MSDIEIPNVHRNQHGELQGSVPYELRRIAENVKSGHWPNRTFGVDIVPMLDELADRAAAERRQVLESVVEDVARELWECRHPFRPWSRVSAGVRRLYLARVRRVLGISEGGFDG